MKGKQAGIGQVLVGQAKQDAARKQAEQEKAKKDGEEAARAARVEKAAKKRHDRLQRILPKNNKKERKPYK